jgi:CDP-glycerol glycerophosphotransferase (TagB/SpsB family)
VKRYLFYIEYDYCYAVLRPLQEAIRARGGETAWLPVGPEVHRRYLRPNERVFDHVRQAIEWNPYAVLVPGNEVPRFLPGLKIEVFHGLNSGKRRRRDGVQYHFIIRGLFDLYCTHGPNTTRRFQELAAKHGHFRVAETGWAKLDPLFDGSSSPPASDRPVALFASTFTPRLSAAPHVLETLRGMAASGGWKWLVNMHPKMPREIVDQYRAAQSEHLELVETDDVIPLLAAADVMLCDTSSILSEFLMQLKPVVTFRTARPADYVLDVQQAEEIEPALRHALSRPPELIENIRRYAEDTHPYRDGRSSERTLDAIDELAARGQAELRRKPLNLYRHWKMRQLLNHWPWD